MESVTESVKLGLQNSVKNSKELLHISIKYDRLTDTHDDEWNRNFD